MDDLAAILVLAGLAALAIPILLIIALVSLSGLKGRVARLEQQLELLRASGVASAGESVAPATEKTSADAPTLSELSRKTTADSSPPPPPPPVPQAPRPPPLPPQRQTVPPRAVAAEPAAREAVVPRPVSASAPSRLDPISLGLRAVKRWFTVGNVPVKIGILVLFAGVAALLRYATTQGWLSMPIEFRLAGIAAASLAALVFAWRKRESHRAFALSLQGGAIGILLLTVFAAFKRYEFIDAMPAFALSVVLIFGAGALAVLQNAKALAVFALLAGFLAPIWLSTGSGNHVALFSYYAVLNLAILGVAWWKPWRILNLLGFAFTFGIGTIWGVLDYAPHKFGGTEPFLLLFFALYLIIPLLYARKQPESRRGFIDGCLVFGAPLVAFSLQAGLLRGEPLPLAFNALGLAAIYAVLAAFLRRRTRYAALVTPYALLAVGFATLAVPLALTARATACVFALEGAAMIWLGLRQQRRLPQISGALLQLLAALAFSLGAVRALDDVAIINPGFMSALLIALAGFASAWAYRQRGHAFAWAFLLWGMAWWLGGALFEIDRFVAWNQAPDAWLVLVAITGWLAAEVHRRHPWTALALITLLGLITAAPLALAQSDAHAQPFAGHGAWAWLIFAVLGVRSLICLRRSEHALAGWAQFAWLLIWPLVLSLLLDWLHQRHQLAQGWRVLAVAAPWLTLAALSLGQWRLLSAPLGESFDGYRRPLQTVYFSVLGIGWLIALTLPGHPSPLPWIPLLNPLELAQLVFVVLLYAWLSRDGVPPSWRAVRPLIVSLLGFLLITSSVLRSAHLWGGIGWGMHGFGTSVAQTSLSVTWSVLGVIGWVIGSRRAHRTLWLAGAVLMGVVLLKLLLVDRGNLGDALGIASFIAYGLLCTVVGYLAPVPPRRVGDTQHEDVTA